MNLMPNPSKPTRWKPKEGLFSGFWVDPVTGKKNRLQRAELAECYRLWAKHKDIRTGRHPDVYQGVKRFGLKSVLHGCYAPPNALGHSGSQRMTSELTGSTWGVGEGKSQVARSNSAIGAR